MIADNVKRILENIDSASPAGGEKVTLVGVTKTRSVSEINELVSCGITTLGENRVQEYREKADKVEGDPVWHIIGSLQTNKLKYIIGEVSLIQSVDSVKLAEAMGAVGIRVTKKEEIGSAIEKAIALQTTVVIDCQIDSDDKVFPMVPAGAANEEVFDQADLDRK